MTQAAGYGVFLCFSFAAIRITLCACSTQEKSSCSHTPSSKLTIICILDPARSNPCPPHSTGMTVNAARSLPENERGRDQSDGLFVPSPRKPHHTELPRLSEADSVSRSSRPSDACQQSSLPLNWLSPKFFWRVGRVNEWHLGARGMWTKDGRKLIWRDKPGGNISTIWQVACVVAYSLCLVYSSVNSLRRGSFTLRDRMAARFVNLSTGHWTAGGRVDILT